MAVIHAPESAHGKELWKWDHTVNERNPHDETIRGMRPVSFQEFPKMLYKATRTDGPPKITETHVVADEREQRNLESRGFHARQEDALTACFDATRAIAAAAAELHYDVRSRGPAAQREAQAAIDTADGHLPEIAETPRKPRGRPKKTPALD